MLERPDGDAPLTLAATPARVAVGQPFAVVVIERGVVLGGLRSVSSVRIGGKPVITARPPGPVATLLGDDDLEIERGPSVTNRESGAGSERVTFYRAVARRPGRLTLGGDYVQGLESAVEVAPATVDVVEP